jgi:general secretion pathway protein H
MTARGFTLLEMLVVIFIAALLTGLATLQLMPTSQSLLRDESKKLAALLENASASARAGGLSLAWSGSGSSYLFWQRDKEGIWQRINNDRLLRPRDMSDAVRVGPVDFNGKALQPGALVLLSPELSARDYHIRLVSGNYHATLIGTELGRVSVEAGEGP